MHTLTYGVLGLLLIGQECAARTIYIKNNCKVTIWPAIFTDANANPGGVPNPTGWEAPPGHLQQITVADNWKASRVWGRSGCNFRDGNTSCETGGCAGGLQCTASGATPATLAEFTLSSDRGGLDNYDVSLVDGFNLPMSIQSNVGCHEASCPVNLNTNCPAQLKVGNSACNSACGALVPQDQRQNSPLCCSGDFATPEKCPASGIPTYSFYKGNCRDAYAYPFDEGSGTALWQCSADKKSDYLITFCP